jgi:hypothetical protein
MRFDYTFFAREFEAALSNNASLLFDTRMRLMKQEIAAGWRAFHGRPAWFMQHLPAPLMTDLGRQINLEALSGDIANNIPGGSAPARSSFRTFLEHAPARSGYRNFLSTGTLELESNGDAFVFDEVANEVTLRLLREQHRHFDFEIRYVNDVSWRDQQELGTLTPEPWINPFDKSPAVRNPDFPLERDYAYWTARYDTDFRFIADRQTDWTPWICDLMRVMSEDFVYVDALTTSGQVVFCRAGDSPVMWALTFPYQSRFGLRFFELPPLLQLFKRKSTGRLTKADLLFTNVLETSRYGGFSKSLRDIELHLLRFLPRARELMAVYDPFVDDAIQSTQCKMPTRTVA